MCVKVIFSKDCPKLLFVLRLAKLNTHWDAQIPFSKLPTTFVSSREGLNKIVHIARVIFQC